MDSRRQAVDLMLSWKGLNEADGSYKQIIDIYNSARGYHKKIAMYYDWPWCACTWSAVACKLGLYDVMPIEISCARLIDEAKKMGCWVEDDNHMPKIGDAILYDWDDDGKGDNKGFPDHVGMVTAVGKDSFTVTEGNMGIGGTYKVGQRKLARNAPKIRGFIAPDYERHDSGVKTPPTSTGGGSGSTIKRKTDDEIALEVVQGLWGSGSERAGRLSSAGYNPDTIQAIVNKIFTPPIKEDPPKVKTATGEGLFSDSRNLLMTVLPKDESLRGIYRTNVEIPCRNGYEYSNPVVTTIRVGTELLSYGYYSIINGEKWIYVVNRSNDLGILFVGFVKECEMEMITSNTIG